MSDLDDLLKDLQGGTFGSQPPPALAPQGAPSGAAAPGDSSDLDDLLRDLGVEGEKASAQAAGGASAAEPLAQPSASNGRAGGQGDDSGGTLPATGSLSRELFGDLPEAGAAALGGIQSSWNNLQRQASTIRLKYPKIGEFFSGRTPEEEAVNFAAQEAQMRSHAPTGELAEKLKKWEKAETFGDVFNSLNDLETFSRMFFESSMSSAPGLIAGAAGAMTGGLPGMAAGRFAGGYLSESASSLGNYLAEKKGVDLTNPEEVAAAFNDPEIMEEATAWARKRGAAVAAVDATVGLIAPKLSGIVAKPFMKKSADVAGGQLTKTGRNLGIGTAFATEVLGEGGGEALAGLATEGEINIRDVATEMMVGMGPSAIETAMDLGTSPLDRGGDLTAPSEGDLADLTKGLAPPEPKVVTPEEAEAEGRTLYGFDDGGDRIDVGTYDEAEKRAAETGVRNGRLIAIDPKETTFSPVEPDFEKLAALPKQVRSRIKLADPTSTQEFQKSLDELIANRGNPEKKQAAIVRARYALSVGPIVQTGGIDPNIITMPPKRQFVRSPVEGQVRETRDLGVKFREVDYGGFDLLQSSDGIVPGAMLKSNYPAPTGSVATRPSRRDINLKMLSPGTLIPKPDRLQTFAAAFGEKELVRLAEAGGSKPEAIQKMVSEIRSGVAAPDVQTEMDQGDLVFTPDPRLFHTVPNSLAPGGRAFIPGAATIRNTPEAAAEVNRAIVERPAGDPRVLKVGPGISPMSNEMLRKDGTVGRLQEYRENAAVLKGFSKEVQETWEAANKAIQSLITTWNLPFNLDVVAYTQSAAGNYPNSVSSYMGRGRAYGYFISIPEVGTDPAGTIVINLDAMRGDPVGLYSIIFHEFGHFIDSAGLWQQSLETRTKVWAAYRRFLLSTASPNGDPQIRQGLPQGNRTSRPDYQYSFEEWFANQVARWALTSRRPVGFMAKVVQPVARMLRAAAARFQQEDPTNQFQAEPEIAAWLDSMVKGTGSTSEWASALESLHELETTIANEKALRGEDIGGASPMMPQTSDMRTVIGKLGVEKIAAAASSTGSTVTGSNINRYMAEADRMNWVYRLFATLPQIALMNKNLTPLQRYRELVEMANHEANQIMMAAQDRLKSWSRLAQAQQQAIGQVLFELSGMDRQPTTVEMQNLVRQYRLSRDGVRVLAGIQQDFVTALDRYIGELRNAAGRISDPGKQAEKMLEIDKMRTALLKKPYFPHLRYGTYSLTVKEGRRVEYFELFESKRQRDVAHRRALQKWPEGSGFKVQAGRLLESSSAMFGVPPQMLAMMEQNLNLSPTQKRDMELLKFQLAPQQSFRKRFLNKKDIPGYSEDAQRNYAHYMFHHAKHHMRVKYQGALNEQLKDLRGLRETVSGKTDAMDNIYSYLVDHMDNFLNPKADWAGVRSFGAVWYLGLNPKSAIMNLTQSVIATTPFLSAKFGDLQTMNAMRRAAMELRTYYSKESIERAAAGANDAEMAAFDEAVRTGKIDESQAAELAAMSEGSRLIDRATGTDVSRRWRWVTEKSMAGFQLAEQFNRRVAFRAAWRLAIDNPGAKWLRDVKKLHPLQYQTLIDRGWQEKHAVAYLAAVATIDQTQFNYAKWARPKFMQGRASVLFMFYMFTQQMLFLGFNKENRSSVGPRMLLTMGFLGGMMGLPGAEDLEDLVKAISRQFDKNWDIEKMAREYVVETFDSKLLADLLLRGVGRYSFGASLFDMPGVTVMPSMDLSSSVGLGHALPFNPAFLFADPGLNYEMQSSQVLNDVLGAVVGIGMGFHEAAMDTSTPFLDIRRWERILPKGIQNVTRAARFAAEGYETMRDGTKVTDFNYQKRFDEGKYEEGTEILLELIGLGLGFNPAARAVGWDMIRKKADHQFYWEGVKGLRMEAYYQAVRKGEGQAEAMKDIRDFNKKSPASIKITNEGLKKSVETRLEKKQLGAYGGARTKAEESVTEDIRRLFPTAREVRTIQSLERDQ